MITDILFHPETGDLLIKNGELVVGDSTDQHTNDLIQSDKGWYKHFPQRGVGATNFINDEENLAGLSSAIRSELFADGQNVESVTIKPGGNLAIQTSYPA
ncbi:hypothetical protein [Spirosoma areae]